MASKRAVRRKACGKKRAYTEKQAYAAVRVLRKKYPTEKIGVYKCKFCSRWHIGHTPYRVRMAVRDKMRRSQ